MTIKLDQTDIRLLTALPGGPSPAINSSETLARRLAIPLRAMRKTLADLRRRGLARTPLSDVGDEGWERTATGDAALLGDFDFLLGPVLARDGRTRAAIELRAWSGRSLRETADHLGGLETARGWRKEAASPHRKKRGWCALRPVLFVGCPQREHAHSRPSVAVIPAVTMTAPSATNHLISLPYLHFFQRSRKRS